MNDEVILRMTNICKAFPGVQALNEVDFELRKGEVHALVGENGAGKSTLIKVLGGIHLAEKGEIELEGTCVQIANPRDAIDLKISIIHQEFNLVPTLNVHENIFLGKELVRKGSRSMDKKLMKAKTLEMAQNLGLSIASFEAPVRNLSIAQQQLVEIGKALFNETNILVMDEPTAVLTSVETEVLFNLIRQFKEEGMAIIYISHRLEEVIELSDRITVLRDGEYVTTLDNSDKTVHKDEIVTHMIGRSIEDYYPERHQDAIKDEVILEVKDLNKEGVFKDISFSVKKGEILGFSGLVGAGRTEIMKAIYGDMSFDSGKIILDGVEKKIKSTTEAIKEGIVLIPEDRKQEGLILLMSLADNISLPNTGKISSFGTIMRRKKTALANEYVEKLSIRPALIHRPIEHFSGGNQQKAVIAKWLATNPKVIILDEPTRGVDVGSKSEIYALVNELSELGVGIIFVSSELPELLGVCDRILAVCEGRITGEFLKKEATEANVMQAACAYDPSMTGGCEIDVEAS